MKIVSDLNSINDTVLFLDISRSDFEANTRALNDFAEDEIEIIFTWNASHFDGRELRLEIIFEDVMSISSNDVRDSLMLTVLDPTMFKSKETSLELVVDTQLSSKIPP